MDAHVLLSRAREQADLTQVELATRSGTSQATLSAYERGHKVPSAATLSRILAAAGQRLAAEPAARPVITPGAAILNRSARTLTSVLELAAELPTRHAPNLRYPRLGTHAAAGP